MNPPNSSPFLTRIAKRRQELEALHSYPVEELAAIIGEVGFSCSLCGRCCTRDFNGYVLLMEDDVVRIRSIDPTCLEPPPEYDLCDQHGTFYVSGYTIRALEGSAGACHFLEGGRCRIYHERPGICRVYPYMLHREPDGEGAVDWRQISGLDQHGKYHSPISEDRAVNIAQEVKAFECSAIEQEIAFLEYTAGYFSQHGLRHVRKRFDDRLRDLAAGASVRVRVYFCGSFETWSVQGGRCIQAVEKKEGLIRRIE